jgi:hypothetical protein
MCFVFASDEGFDGEEVGLVPRECFGFVASAVEVLRVGVHVARYAVLDDFPAVGDEVSPVASQTFGQAFSEGVIYE